MDVSLAPQTHESICENCGYSRRGFPAQSRCPECGEPPPTAAHTAKSASRTVEELRWLRTLAIALWLLILSSAGALQVALIMPIGESSVGAINFPGPKLFASALVQRTIGGEPGFWGVYGTLCVMLSALAVYLLTEPRVLEHRDESTFSLRKLTRWVSLLSLGGFAGLLFSGFESPVYYRSSVSISLFTIGVAFCELPSNTLLYFYLLNLSRRLGDVRATRALSACAIGIPILCCIAVAFLVINSDQISALHTPWRVSIMIYAGAALALGITGTAATLRLAWGITVIAFAGWARSAPFTLSKLQRLLPRAMIKADLQWPKWCAIIGVLLWLYSVPLCVKNVIFMPTRVGLGGGIPLLNFAGPKVSVVSLVRAAAVRDETDDDGEGMPTQDTYADALTLLAVWLLTYSIPGLDPAPRWRWAARYGALAMTGASLGAVLAVSDLNTMGPSHFTAWAVLTVQAPATFILYTYLSRLAAHLSDAALARRLGRVAWATACLAVSPLPLLLLSRSMHAWRLSWTAAFAGGAFLTVSMGVSLIACCAVAKLGWRLLQHAVGDARPKIGA
jgi:hypothetical protein